MNEQTVSSLKNDITRTAQRDAIPLVNPGIRGSTQRWMHGDSEENFRGKIPERFRSLEFDYRINSQGYREEEFDFETPSILCLGDSFTFGIGLPKHETWSARLEDISGIKCVNLSEGGASNNQILRTLRQSIRLFNVVGVVGCLTDLSRQEYYHVEHDLFFTQKLLPNTGGKTPSEKRIHKLYLKGQSETDSFIRFVQHVQGMEDVCRGNQVPFFWSTWDHEVAALDDDFMALYFDPACRMPHFLKGMDVARDNGHFGHVSNDAFAQLTYDAIKDTIK